VEQYLRLVTLAAPEDWMQWLALALAVHNNRKNMTMGLSPNQILLRYEITLMLGTMPLTLNESAEERHHIMMERRAQVIEAINQAAEKAGKLMAQYTMGTQVVLRQLPSQS
jgi:hypothetical protein